MDTHLKNHLLLIMKKKYSITKDKRRISADKYLVFGAEKFIRNPSNLSEINENDDWSLMFNITKKDSITKEPIIYNAVSALTQSGFLVYHYNNKIVFFTIQSGTPISYSFNFNHDVFNKNVSYVLSFNSSTNLLSVYANTVLVDSHTILENFTTNQTVSYLGHYFPDVIDFTIGLVNIIILDRQVTEQERNYYYQNNIISESLHINCRQFYTFDGLLKSDEIAIFEKTITTSGYGSGVLFDTQFIGDSNIEVTIGDGFINRHAFVSITSSTNTYLLADMIHGIQMDASGNLQEILNGSQNGVMSTYVIGDVIKIERIGTEINFYKNNGLIKNIIGVSTINYNINFTMFSPLTQLTNVKLNGVNLKASESTSVNINNVTLIDSVANYNYAKPSENLVGNHGQLIGWTDDVLGLTKLSSKSAFKDFYSKRDYLGIGSEISLPINVDSQSLIIPSLMDTVDFSSGFSVVFKVVILDNTTENVLSAIQLLSKNVAGEKNNITFRRSGGTGEFNLHFVGNTQVIASETVQFNKELVIVITVDNNFIKQYINGVEVDSTVTANGYLIPKHFSSLLNGNQFYYRGLYNSILTENEIRTAYHDNENWISLNPVGFYGNQFTSTGAIDLSNNIGEAIFADSAWVDSNLKFTDLSGYQPRKYGLTFNSASTQYLTITDFNPTKEEGYTVLAGFAGKTTTPDAFFNTIFTKRNLANTTNRFGLSTISNSTDIAIVAMTTDGHEMIHDGSFKDVAFYSVLMSQEKEIKDYEWSSGQYMTGSYNTSKRIYLRDDNPIVNPDLQGFDELDGECAIGRLDGTSRPLNNHLLYLAVFKGLLNNHEIKELYNNGNFSNPSITLREKYELVLYPDFNNPYDDGGTLKIPDLSDSNHDITAFGWTDLSALETARIEISSLL